LVLIYQGQIVARGTPRELKREVKETILAVHPEDLDAALSLIKQLPGVAEAAVFGDGLHVVVAEPQEGERRITEVLAAHNIALQHHIERVPLSLEDAFIAVVQRAERDLKKLAAISDQPSAIS
jgi:ABC-2 type transport system ATP-binding protein